MNQDRESPRSSTQPASEASCGRSLALRDAEDPRRVFVAASLACASASEPSAPSRPAGASGHGYALLYAILEQESRSRSCSSSSTIARARGRHLRDRRHLRRGVRAARGARRAHPRLDLADTGLPAEEVRARELIGATRRELLLASSARARASTPADADEALTYAGALADTLSRQRARPRAASRFVRTLGRI